MAKKAYTHSAGFNITSLKGLSAIYILYKTNNEIVYAGSCEDKNVDIENWKSRFQSHRTYEGRKLTSDVSHMDVIIPNQDISHQHLLVLEYLLIWYLRPPRNLPKGIMTHWRYFYWTWGEESVKQVAKESYNFQITGSVKEFLRLFDVIRIQREWDDCGNFKKYGNIEQLEGKKISCTGKRKCICLNCIATKRHRHSRLNPYMKEFLSFIPNHLK